MKTIIVLCEANNRDPILLKHTESIAKAFGSTLHLIHVAAAEPDFVGYTPDLQHTRDNRAKILHKEHSFLQGLVHTLHTNGIAASALLLQGETVSTALKKAKQLEADLIVLGSHHNSMLHHLVSGKTGEKIIHRSHCPLLVVPL